MEHSAQSWVFMYYAHKVTNIMTKKSKLACPLPLLLRGSHADSWRYKHSMNKCNATSFQSTAFPFCSIAANIHHSLSPTCTGGTGISTLYVYTNAHIVGKSPSQSRLPVMYVNGILISIPLYTQGTAAIDLEIWISIPLSSWKFMWKLHLVYIVVYQAV